MTAILPWGLANFIAAIIFRYSGRTEFLMYILAVIELAMIVFGKYPTFIKLKFNARINALIFYLSLNILTNVIVFLWAFHDLSV